MDYKEIVVKNGQSLLDISVQEYGNVEGVFALVIDNTDKINAFSDVLIPGTKLKIRRISPYAIQVGGNQVTNSNSPIYLGSGYVALGYVASGYVVSNANDIARINKGISEFQLELII